MSENEGEEETEGLESLAEAFAGPRRGVAQDLVIKHLLDAVTAPPLRKIHFTTEAALMTPGDQAEKLGIDLELVKRLHTVAHSLENVNKGETHVWWYNRRYTDLTYYSVPWPFDGDEENYQLYAAPWRKGPYQYHSSLIKLHLKTQKVYRCEHCRHVLLALPWFSREDRKKREEAEKKLRETIKVTEHPNYSWRKHAACPRCERNLLDRWSDELEHVTLENNSFIYPDPEWSFFWEATCYLTDLGVKELNGQFVAYAMPLNQRLTTLITQTVSQDRFRELLQLYIKKERKEREQQAE